MDLRWCRPTMFIFFYLFFFSSMPFSVTWARSSSSSHFESNDVNLYAEEQLASETPTLPECAEHAICTYLQANVRGINKQPICACPGTTQCSSTWDAFDGHSVAQGSDQYKYCYKAPLLPACEPGMVAYHSVSYMSKVTGDVIRQDDKNRCICPEHATFEIVDRKFDELEELEKMEITYVCRSMNVCEHHEVCKAISETPSTYLVNPKCRCPASLHCPSTTSGAAVQTLNFGKGSLHTIRCH